jgi:two-component system sensor histidine kinase DesK
VAEVDQTRPVDPTSGLGTDAGSTAPESTFEPRGRTSMFYRSAAFVFIAYPILLLISRSPDVIEAALVLTGTVTFVGLLVFASRLPSADPQRSSPIGAVLVLLLLAVAIALVLRSPESGFYPFFYFASTGASPLLPVRRALALMVLSGIAAGLSVLWLSGDLATAIVQGVSVTIIGVTIFSTAQVRRTNMQLTRARHEVARLAVADERMRIARDLHDTLGQSLSVITLKSELAGRLLPADPVRARGEVLDIERVARDALAAVRETVGGYRQPTLKAELAAARKALEAADIVPTIDAIDDDLPPAVEAVLAWTIREGVTNVVRHSGAKDARIHIVRQGSWAEASITDDGRGPARTAGTSGTPNQAPGTGLVGLAERIAALGGRFETGRTSDGGFRLTVALPLDAALT